MLSRESTWEIWTTTTNASMALTIMAAGVGSYSAILSEVRQELGAVAARYARELEALQADVTKLAAVIAGDEPPF